MFINITVSGDKELIAKLDRMPLSVQASLYRKAWELALRLENWIKTNKLNGGVLNRITGRLARSIGSKVEQTTEKVIGRVFQSSDVPYGGIHEWGGRIPAHIILPKKANVLKFAMGGETMYRMKVNHPGSTMPERSYMRSSLRDLSADISLGLKEAVIMGLRDA
jgi:phage gpG-like protein